MPLTALYCSSTIKNRFSVFTLNIFYPSHFKVKKNHGRGKAENRFGPFKNPLITFLGSSNVPW